MATLKVQEAALPVAQGTAHNILILNCTALLAGLRDARRKGENIAEQVDQVARAFDTRMYEIALEARRASRNDEFLCWCMYNSKNSLWHAMHKHVFG